MIGGIRRGWGSWRVGSDAAKPVRVGTRVRREGRGFACVRNGPEAYFWEVFAELRLEYVYWLFSYEQPCGQGANPCTDAVAFI